MAYLSLATGLKDLVNPGGVRFSDNQDTPDNTLPYLHTPPARRNVVTPILVFSLSVNVLPTSGYGPGSALYTKTG